MDDPCDLPCFCGHTYHVHVAKEDTASGFCTWAESNADNHLTSLCTCKGFTRPATTTEIEEAVAGCKELVEALSG